MVYYDRFCGCGGIGRRAGFRFLWATVQVQLLSTAPTIKDTPCGCLFRCGRQELKLKKAREIRKTHCVFSERGSGLCPRRRQTCRKARLRPIRGAYPYSCVCIPKNALRFPHPNHICATPGNVRRHRLVSNKIPATLIASYNRPRSTNLRFFDFCRFKTDKIIDIYNFVEYNNTKTMGAIL